MTGTVAPTTDGLARGVPWRRALLAVARAAIAEAEVGAETETVRQPLPLVPAATCADCCSITPSTVDVLDIDGEAVDILVCGRCGVPRRLRPLVPIGVGDDEPLPVVSTGYPALDAALGGGLVPGVYIVAAPTGSGKTALLTALADGVASTGRSVIYGGLEPSAREIRARLAARRTGRPWTAYLRHGGATDILPPLPIVGVWGRDPSGDDVAATVWTYGTTPLVIVDHLHARVRGEDRRSAVAERVDALADLAAQYGVSVIAASQVARSWYADDGQRRAGRDYLAAAKESGEVEALSWGLMFLRRDRLHVAKVRDGVSDTVLPIDLDLATCQLMIHPAEDAERHRRLDDDVLAAIARAPTPPSRRALRDALRAGPDEIAQAVGRLIAEGLITEVEVEGRRSDGRRHRYRGLRVVDPVAASVVGRGGGDHHHGDDHRPAAAGSPPAAADGLDGGPSRGIRCDRREHGSAANLNDDNEIGGGRNVSDHRDHHGGHGTGSARGTGGTGGTEVGDA